MKKLIINIFSIIASLLLAVNVFAAPLPFSDVPESAWYYNDVRTAYRSGLINGKSATKFAPDANLTYAEAVKLAACLNQFFEEGSVTLKNGDPWYQSYVDYCTERGIITREYDWSENATRGGYMGIFARALSEDVLYSMNEIQDGAIPDVPMDHPEAEGIYKLYRAGILQGSDAETHACNPETGIRRSEVSAIIARILDSDRRIKFDMVIDIPFEMADAPVDAYPKDASGQAVFAVEARGNDVKYDWQVFDLETMTWVSICDEAVLKVEYDFTENELIPMYRCVLRDGDEELVTDTVSVYPPITVVKIAKMPTDRQRFVSIILSCTNLELKSARAIAESGQPCEIRVNDSAAGDEMVTLLAEIGGEATAVAKSSSGLRFVRLTSVGENRIEVIRLIDKHTGCGLTEAQHMVKETLPIIGRFMTEGAAASMVSDLASVGATAEIE